MIDSDQLASFIVFAECRNFTQAARKLAISQPSLHVKIRKLADSLGVALYRRIGRSLELTREGERLLGFARDLAERSTRFEAELHGRRDEQPIILAAGEGAYLYLLGEAIRSFSRRRGNPRLSLLVRDRDETLAAVRCGEAHLGVAALEDRPADLFSEKLVEVEMVAVLPARHRLARRRRLRLADLQGERWIVPPQGRPHRAVLSRALGAAGIQWEPAVETSGWELMLHFARMGVGIAVVNSCCRIPRGLVAKLLPELPGIPYYVLQRERVTAPGAAELRDCLLEKLQARS